jgi:hypothetical protein
LNLADSENSETKETNKKTSKIALILELCWLQHLFFSVCFEERTIDVSKKLGELN